MVVSERFEMLGLSRVVSWAGRTVFLLCRSCYLAFQFLFEWKFHNKSSISISGCCVSKMLFTDLFFQEKLFVNWNFLCFPKGTLISVCQRNYNCALRYFPFLWSLSWHCPSENCVSQRSPLDFCRLPSRTMSSERSEQRVMSTLFGVLKFGSTSFTVLIWTHDLTLICSVGSRSVNFGMTTA